MESPRPYIVIVDEEEPAVDRLRADLHRLAGDSCDICVFSEVDPALEFLRDDHDVALVLTELVFRWWGAESDVARSWDGIRLVSEFGNRVNVAVWSYPYLETDQVVERLKSGGISVFAYVDKRDTSSVRLQDTIERALVRKDGARARPQLFISYTRRDSGFVERLEQKLELNGFECWRDVHDVTAGRLEKQIKKAIGDNHVVLLVLSQNSVCSDWVQHEARLARRQEIVLGHDILCPVALDDSWKTCNWPERLKEQILEYHVLDFSEWRASCAFQEVFSKLIKGLAEYYMQDRTTTSPS